MHLPLYRRHPLPPGGHHSANRATTWHPWSSLALRTLPRLGARWIEVVRRLAHGLKLGHQLACKGGVVVAIEGGRLGTKAAHLVSNSLEVMDVKYIISSESYFIESTFPHLARQAVVQEGLCDEAVGNLGAALRPDALAVEALEGAAQRGHLCTAGHSHE